MRHLIIAAFILVCSNSAEVRFAEFNDRGVAFGHVHGVVADIELHKRLWPDLFDAVLVQKQGYSAVRVSNALIFFRDAEPTASSMRTAMNHFGLTVRNVEDILSRWRALGYEVDSEETDEMGLSSAHITMPGGVRLALHENPKQSESTSMGYVHFVTPIRVELMAWYATHFGATARSQDDSENASIIPGSVLSFEDSETRRLPTEGTAIDHIGFEIQEWDAFIEILEDAGIQFEFGPTYIESLDLWVAFFNEPSGVLVEITQGLDRF